MQKIKDFFKKIFTKENMKKFYFSFVWLMVLVFVADIASKWIVINHFGASHANGYESVTVVNKFFYIVFRTNEGAAWSLLSDSRTFWIIVSVVLSGGLIAYYIVKYKSHNTWTRAALALMIAGAVGNMIDRCFYWESTTGFSGVVDWLSFYLPTGEFPTFNIADSALVVGVGILVVLLFIDLIKDALKKSEAEQAQLQKQKQQQNSDKVEKSPANPGQNEESVVTEKDTENEQNQG